MESKQAICYVVFDFMRPHLIMCIVSLLKMDIISQLQEQINTIAALTFNTFGTLQRDTPPVRLSPNYPEPPTNPTEDTANIAEQTKQMSSALVKAAKQVQMILHLNVLSYFHPFNNILV